MPGRRCRSGSCGRMISRTTGAGRAARRGCGTRRDRHRGPRQTIRGVTAAPPRMGPGASAIVSARQSLTACCTGCRPVRHNARELGGAERAGFGGGGARRLSRSRRRGRHRLGHPGRRRRHFRPPVAGGAVRQYGSPRRRSVPVSCRVSACCWRAPTCLIHLSSAAHPVSVRPGPAVPGRPAAIWMLLSVQQKLGRDRLSLHRKGHECSRDRSRGCGCRSR